MSEVEVEPKTSSNGIMQQKGIISKIFSILFYLAISCFILWNWDGFWQTDIKPLKKVQKSYFSAKYNEEQLKLSRIIKNNDVVDDIEARLKAYESKSISDLIEANFAKDKSDLRAIEAEEKLAEYTKTENLKCRYYDTSLRMISHLTKKYSSDELARTINCTSKECEIILKSKLEAFSICNNS